jgi:hypothetical protein
MLFPDVRWLRVVWAIIFVELPARRRERGVERERMAQAREARRAGSPGFN